MEGFQRERQVDLCLLATREPDLCGPGQVARAGIKNACVTLAFDAAAGFDGNGS